jgi:CRP-like cAMP-binding protein/Zn-dependent protease
MPRGKEDQRSSVSAILKERLASPPDPEAKPSFPVPVPAPSSDAIDVWKVLDERLDLTLFHPKLADDVEIRIFRLRWGNDYAMIANPRRLIHFQLQVWEAELAQRMDGSRSVGEIIVERLEGTGDLDASSVAELVVLLRNEGFLDPHPMNVTAAVADELHPPPRLREKLSAFAKTLRVDWSGADRHVRWWYRTILRPLFTPAGAALTAIPALGGFVAFLFAQFSGRFSIGEANAPLDSLVLLVLAFVLTYAHELGHALGLVHYDRRIKSAGFMLYFGSPAFFVDASDGLMLDRGARILEAALGPYSEMVLAGLASFLLVAFPSAAVAPLIYRFCVLNYFLIFENLIPLLELDGYFILSESIEVPDLRERSLQFIQHDLWHKLRGHERLSRQEVALGAYAVIGVAFTIFSIYLAIFFWRAIFGSMIVALWRGGTGSRLLLLLLALFLAGPAIRGLIALGRTTGRRLRGLWRRLKFKFETSWRVEAAEMIDALPAFNELPEDALSDLAGRVRLVAFRPGEPVFRQGDRPTAFYVVRRGTLDVEEENPDTGDTVLLRSLARGDPFGELGLLHASPRTATVRAVDDAELFEVDKPTFDRLLADAIDAPAFALTLQTMAELRDMPAFAMLGSEGIAEILAHGKWITAAPGEVLVQQGAVGDAFYALRSGRADVVRDGELLRTLGSGSHFGEIALLRDVPRTASVIARTPVRAFRLSREGFDRVVREAFQRGALKLPSDKTWQH